MVDNQACPECDCLDTRKFGFQLTRKGRTQRYQCKKCGRVFIPYLKKKKVQKVQLEVT